MHPPRSRCRDKNGDADDPGGLSAKEWRRIAALLVIGLGLAGLLLFVVPLWLVSDRDYRCPPPPATGQLTSSCLAPGAAGGVDHRALSEARAGARVPFGVFSAALLAGTAAAVGVIVSSHNARLTHRALTATSTANNLTEQRDRDTAARERERAGDDRYTSAIDQLGHPSASVRLGAMHSLHRLAQGDLGRLPTVVDVLCAYLRQPFHHPTHDWDRAQHPPGATPPARAWWPASQKERDERDSEREVRSTATRLIPTLLPTTSAPTEAGGAPQTLDINLRGAMLDSPDFSGRRMKRLFLDGAHIDGDLRFGDGAHITGTLQLGKEAHIDGALRLGKGSHVGGDLRFGDGAHITGTLRLGKKAHIDGDLRFGDGAYITGTLQLDEGAHIDRLWLSEEAHIDGPITLDPGAHIDGPISLREGAHFDGLLLGEGARINGDLRLGKGAYINGDLWLHDGARINGSLTRDQGAYIHGSLTCDGDARVGAGFDAVGGPPA